MRTQIIKFLDQDETEVKHKTDTPAISVKHAEVTHSAANDLAWHLFYDKRITSCEQITVGDDEGEGFHIWLEQP